MSDTGKKNNKSSEDAYDELMDSYFGAPLGMKSSDKKPVSSPEKKSFNLKIDNLDSEFNTGGRQSDRPSSAQVYKRPDPVQRKKPVRLYKPVDSGQHSEKTDSDISLMPAFENDRRFAGDRDSTKVMPVYKDEQGQTAKRRQPKSAKTKKAKSKPLFGSLLAQKKPKAADAQQTPQPVRRTASGAVISRVNTAKKKPTVQAVFKKYSRPILTVLICIIAAVLISSYAISCANDILAVKRDSENVVTVNLPSGVDTGQAIKILKANKLIKHRLFCTVFASFMNYRDDNYLTGIYYLTDSMGLENMLSTFKRPTMTGEVVQLTFPEGFNVDQIAEKLEKYEVCEKTAFYTTLKEIDFSSEYSFVSQIDSKEKRYQVLEGYLYPDTYEFYIGENPSSVIRKFLDNFKSKWTDEYQARANQLGMSVDDVITLASIIEKEAYGDEQMPLVSSVLHNRLRKKALYPTLQCNATKDYVDNYIKKSTEDSVSLNSFNQSYNTYKCEGLPVGAICNPGNAAINAALNPADTNYLYFSHDKSKKIYLATTDAERMANDFARSQADKAAGDN